MKTFKWLGLGLLAAIAAATMAACAPAETIIQTVIVSEDGEETIVTVEVPVESEGDGEGEGTDTSVVIPAEDGLVACNEANAQYQFIPANVAETEAAAPVAPSAYAASSSSASTFAAMASADVVAQSGTVYRVGIFSDITTTNYFAANGPDNTVWNSYVLPPRPTLYGLANVTFDFVPGLAVSLDDVVLTEEDGMWVSTIRMRDDVTWSDGTPVTAADLAFTASVRKDFGLLAGGWASWYDTNYLDHIEVVDDFTAKIIYHTKPGLAVHQYGILQSPILNAAFWSAAIDEAGARAPLDGVDANDSEALAAAQVEAQDILYAIVPEGEPLAGAFLFDTWEAGAFAENDANPNFYDSGTTVTYYDDGTYMEARVNGDVFQAYGEGAGEVSLEYTVGPNVDSAVYTIYGSQDAAVLALRNGEVDFLLNPLGLQRGLLGQVEGDPNLAVIRNNVNGFRYMSFNNRRQPMNDCAFRQAMATLIDKQFVTNTILQGVAFPLYSFVPEGNAAWYSDAAPRYGFNQDGTGMDRETRLNTAVAILKNAGFTWDGNEPAWDADNLSPISDPGRLLLPDGQPVPDLELLAPSPGYDPLRSTFAIWVETWARDAGIPLTANLTGFNIIVQKVYTEQSFDIFILGWSLGIFPDYLYDFFSEEQSVLDGNNAGGYYNAEFEELGKQLKTCDSIETCKEISDQIQILLGTEVPYVVLFDTGIIETYRSASVEYPFTSQLSGLQYSQGVPALVTVK